MLAWQQVVLGVQRGVAVRLEVAVTPAPRARHVQHSAQLEPAHTATRLAPVSLHSLRGDKSADGSTHSTPLDQPAAVARQDAEASGRKTSP